MAAQNVSGGFERPRWLRDVLRFLPLKPQFVLSGNVRDHQLAQAGPGSVAAQPIASVLASELRAAGYGGVASYDPLNGFRAILQPGEDPASGPELLTRLGLQPGADGSAPAGLELFSTTLQRVVAAQGEPVALVADFASRLLVRIDALSGPEHQAFTRALVLAHQARARPHGSPPKPFLNTVVWIVDKEGDLPDWFLIENPRVRHVPVAKPDSGTRRELAKSLLRGFDGYRTAPDAAANEALDAFVDQTEGLLLVDLASIATLGRGEGLPFSAIGDAVRRYKVGVTEDPWGRIPIEKIRGGTEYIRARVKGQDHAVTHIMDIVKRAVTGVGAPKRGNRPRGVAFLAGPTGVGKTELAKTLTSLLFGDEGAYIRFDMSEFSAEHSDQRLVGAPPGYVGYDVGGELTNAIREKPFSVVLFDEIEKAHPRILDKFLQILDDGVLTSGRGDRVYFSEAFIVFTSNLGIYRLEPDGSRVPNVMPHDTFGDVQARVRDEIERHFKLTLNRPEILNRIGENVLVFDFIRADTADEIFGVMVDGILKDVVPVKGASVTLGDAARAALRQLCLADLSNGGRGIRNKVEAHLGQPARPRPLRPQPGAWSQVDHRGGHSRTGRRHLAPGRHEAASGSSGMTALALSRIHYPVTTLGPGKRLAIWFQGCSIRCKGCVSMDTWAPGREWTTVRQVVAAATAALLDADGVTVSGGEPFDQPEALLALLHQVRRLTDADILVYTGYSLEQVSGRLPAFHGLIDCLMTDPFDTSAPQTLALRGGDNQRLACLTPLGRKRMGAYDRVLAPGERALDAMFDDATGEVFLAGIPRPGDMRRLAGLLAGQGHSADVTEDARTSP